MKKTVSILTALLLAVSPASQRAYALKATTQVQQNVEESKASKVWSTVKECAGKAANAVVENKEVLVGVSALLGAGSFATYNGVTMQESIKIIWASEGITMAQKLQLIVKVLFLRQPVTKDDLASLKNSVQETETTEFQRKEAQLKAYEADLTAEQAKISDAESKISSIKQAMPKLKLEVEAAKCQTQAKCTNAYTGEDKETLCNGYDVSKCQETLKNLEVRNDIEAARKTITSMETSIGNIEKQLTDYRTTVEATEEKIATAEREKEDRQLAINYNMCMADAMCKEYKVEGEENFCKAFDTLPENCEDVIKEYEEKFGKKAEQKTEEQKVADEKQEEVKDENQENNQEEVKGENQENNQEEVKGENQENNQEEVKGE